MIWAMWKYYVPENQRSGINFFMSLAVDNALSKTLIRRAMDSEGVALSQNPIRFDPTSDRGLALLGTYRGTAMRRVWGLLISLNSQIFQVSQD
jgi:hypothetical protein